LFESVNEGILVIFGEAINISNFPYKTIEWTVKNKNLANRHW
jgi:hypothetical protein